MSLMSHQTGCGNISFFSHQTADTLNFFVHTKRETKECERAN